MSDLFADIEVTRQPVVLNAHQVGTAQDGAAYVGRGSVWGNPFKIGEDGDRAEVIRKYEEYLLESPELLARLPELTGLDLICWCAPRACHAEVLLRLANPELRAA